MTECQWCGGLFEQHGMGRPRKFCKQSCKQRAYESRKWKIGDIWSHFAATYADCYLCRLPLDWSDPQSMCPDHVIATVHGGRTDVENLRPVHLLCNARKGARLYVPDETSDVTGTCPDRVGLSHGRDERVGV